MTVMYIVGQICGIIAWILLLISYHAKRENKVIFYQILASVLYIVNYFCLGAMTGLWISFFELIKSFFYYKTDKDEYIYFFTIPVYFLILYYTGFNMVDLIAVVGSLVDGYVMLKNKKTMVIGGIISYFLWVIYDSFFLDFSGIISDGFVVVSNIIILIQGYNKYLHRSSIYTVRSQYITKNTVDVIEKLDRQNLDRCYRWDKDKIEDLTKKKKYSYILVKDENKVVGYVNFLNLDEKVYKKMVKSEVFFDDFTNKDILDWTKNRRSFVNLNAIVLNDVYNNKNTISKIENAIKRYIKFMRKNRYFIDEICSFAVNDLEVTILENLGFEKVRNITNECFLYKKEI